MSETMTVTKEMFHTWAEDENGPVALCLKQKLLPVEGDGGVVFPPTYANADGYLIDDGVVQMDSVGSQANRLEPVFKSGRPAALVPKVTIKAGDGEVSLLDVPHRIADALVRCSDAQKIVSEAFSEYQKKGDALRIAKLAPTTLVFGAWDSRDGGAKLPRLVQSVIRAWGASELRRAAQFTPAVDYVAIGAITQEDKKKGEENKKSAPAQRGFVHVPSGETPGGVIASGGIWREVLVNLIPLRALKAGDAAASPKLRKYVLGLALVAAAMPQDGFLRQGCLLTGDPDAPPHWQAVMRDGTRSPIALTAEVALSLAEPAATEFGVGDPHTFTFDKVLAQKDLKEAGKAEKPKDTKSEAAAAGNK